MYHREKECGTAPAEHLLPRLWGAIPQKLSKQESAAYLKNPDWGLMRAHGRHLAISITENAGGSLQRIEDLCVGEVGEYIFHHILHQCLQTRREANLTLWQETGHISAGSLEFRFEEQGNIIVADTSKRARRQKLAEFDGCLIDTAGSLYFLDTTVSSTKLQEKLDYHRKIDNVLQAVRDACNVQACAGHVYLADHHAPQKIFMSQPNVAVWNARDFLGVFNTPIRHYAQEESRRISLAARIQ